MNSASYRPFREGFTLLEILAVVAIAVVLTGLGGLALSSLKRSTDGGGAITRIEAVLDRARSYAMAHHTYVWVGIYEENGSLPSTTPATPGRGRLILCTVASADGTRYRAETIQEGDIPAFGQNDPLNPVPLQMVGRLVKIEGITLVALNQGNWKLNRPGRPGVEDAYEIASEQFLQYESGWSGSVKNSTATFTFPLDDTPQYPFQRLIEFNPLGAASKVGEFTFEGPGSVPWIELAFQPAIADQIDPRFQSTNDAIAAIQIDGFSGSIQIYEL